MLTLFLLLIPAVAGLFISQVNWTVSDFLVMAVLLFGALYAAQLTWQNLNSQRRLFGVALVALAFLYIWAELAVGIFFSFGS